MAKRLYKSRSKVFFGVCGGIAEFFNIDPTIIRIAFLVLVFAGFGTGILIYIAGALIIPDRSVDNGYADDYNQHMRDASSYDKGNNNYGEAGSSDDDFNSYFNKRK
ncbi:MAG: PspC domain-containing protein [Treponemataceae bacterium]|nr:PspC domain-containing protein [Treponemataceae bacterium]